LKSNKISVICVPKSEKYEAKTFHICAAPALRIASPYTFYKLSIYRYIGGSGRKYLIPAYLIPEREARYPPAKRAKARGIAAEPPVGADLCVCPKGDGADSPTRGAERAEAARPNKNKELSINCPSFRGRGFGIG
jgi:hypothetical protein